MQAPQGRASRSFSNSNISEESIAQFATDLGVRSEGRIWRKSRHGVYFVSLTLPAKQTLTGLEPTSNKDGGRSDDESSGGKKANEPETQYDTRVV